MKKRTEFLIFFIVFFAVLAIIGPSAQAEPAFHFGFKKSKNGKLPSINQEGFKHILKKYDAIFLGDTSKKDLYLTFDNGYENGYTPKILDILKEKKVPAIFFVTGHYVKSQPALIKRMVDEGHIIGNHSDRHPDMTKISDTRMKKELDQVKTEVANITSQKEMKFVRAPRGTFSERSLKVCHDLGYTDVFWSIAYKDWDVNQQKGWNYAYRSVMKQLHPGAVILLHTVSKDNAEALAKIIDDARKEGYVFKSLDQLTIKNYG